MPAVILIGGRPHQLCRVTTGVWAHVELDDPPIDPDDPPHPDLLRKLNHAQYHQPHETTRRQERPAADPQEDHEAPAGG